MLFLKKNPDFGEAAFNRKTKQKKARDDLGETRKKNKKKTTWRRRVTVGMGRGKRQTGGEQTTKQKPKEGTKEGTKKKKNHKKRGRKWVLFTEIFVENKSFGGSCRGGGGNHRGKNSFKK